MLWWLSVIVGGGFVVLAGCSVAIWALMTPEERREAGRTPQDRLADLGFHPDYIFLNPRGGIAIDLPRRKLALYEGQAWQEFGFDDITEAGIAIDGETVTQTSRSRSLTGTAVGGVLFGPAGAVVGGLGGGTRSRSQEQVMQVDLNIIIYDFVRPCRVVHFMHYKAFLATMSNTVEAKQKASEWLARLRMVMAGTPGLKPNETHSPRSTEYPPTVGAGARTDLSY